MARERRGRSETITNAAAPTDAQARRPNLQHPIVVQHATQRSASLQLRLADKITRVAGSMRFVYFHIVAFAAWMLFGESNPWPTLTLAVSLEAIFLSTFVMIGQNRQAEFQQAKADHDFATEAQELRDNTDLTRAVHALTAEIHRQIVPGSSASGAPPEKP